MRKGQALLVRLLIAVMLLVSSSSVMGGERGDKDRTNTPPRRDGPPRADRPDADFGSGNGEVRHITDKNVVAAVKKGVSAVYFWAEWCGPCRTQGPIMETVAKKYEGKVKIFKMNVDEEKLTAEKFQVKQIPTTILFRNGRPSVKLVGLIREDEFDEEIEELMKKPPPKKRPPQGS